MKNIGLKMSLLMSVTMSFCLSLTGNLTSGHFTLMGFITSFLMSLVISFLIGFFVPMNKVNEKLFGNMERGLKRKCLETLISDLIYTPLITIAMIIMAYKQATSHGAKIPFVPMLLKALIISLVVGYIIIYIVQPLFLKLLMKNSGAGAPPQKRD